MEACGLPFWLQDQYSVRCKLTSPTLKDCWRFTDHVSEAAWLCKREELLQTLTLDSNTTFLDPPYQFTSLSPRADLPSSSSSAGTRQGLNVNSQHPPGFCYHQGVSPQGSALLVLHISESAAQAQPKAAVRWLCISFSSEMERGSANHHTCSWGANLSLSLELIVTYVPNLLAPSSHPSPSALPQLLPGRRILHYREDIKSTLWRQAVHLPFQRQFM